MNDAPMSERHFSQAEAVAYITDALARENVSQPNALSVAKALVNAEIAGQKGHGFSRVASYAACVRPLPATTCDARATCTTVAWAASIKPPEAACC